MRRSTLLISIALMLAVVAAACGSAVLGPAAEPPAPTPFPTVTVEAEDSGNAGADSGASDAGSFEESLADPAVRQCLEEQLGESFDPESVGPGGDLFGRLGFSELAVLEECGVDVSGGFGTAFGGRRDGGAFGGGGGGGGAGGGAGAGAFTPESQECLAELLGEDFTGGFGGFGGRGDGDQPRGGQFGGGIGDEFAAAFEECGIDFGDGGGFGGFADRGAGGRGFGGGTFGGGDIQECLIELLGPDGLQSLRNADGPPSEELLDAFDQCGGAIPVEPDGGIGDGADPLPIEPTPTPIPASDLAIEVLSCLAGELEPADLAAVVIATSAGDLTELSDEALAALATCGFES